MVYDNNHSDATVHEGKKEITIIVNARPKTIEDKTLSFEEIIILAFDANDSNPDVIYVVTYSDKHGNSSHELSKGQTVKAKEGMIFNVTPTNRS